MYLSGRWIPIDLANSLLALTLLMAVIMAGLLYFLGRRGRPSKRGKTTGRSSTSMRGKRNSRQREKVRRAH